MHSSPEAAAELDRLVEHLAGRRGAILAAVREAVRGDPRVATAAKLPRALFIDHLPKVLEAFEERLRARTRGEKLAAVRQECENAEGHGLNRWQQGYALSETIIEWRHLHECMLAEIERYSTESGSLSGATLLVAMRELGGLLGDGVSTSADRHSQLLQAESATRAQELKSALAEVQAFERERAGAWREALHDLRGGVGVVRSASALLSREAGPGPGISAPAATPIAQALKEATDVALAGAAEPESSIPMPERSAPHGEGLGLLIVKRLSELLDASVELETAAGSGTIFRVTFPTAYESSPRLNRSAVSRGT